MQDEKVVYLTGEYLPFTQAHISPLDRGFLFGDGVYEVMKSQKGAIFFYDRHIQRLRNSLAGLQIEFHDFEGLAQVFSRLLAANKLDRGEAFIYLQISRGAYSQRTHEFPSAPPLPTVFAMAFERSTTHSKTIRLISRPDERWMRCNLKTINLLDNVLAKQQAVEADAEEVVLVRDGMVVECSSSALALVKDEILYCHPPALYLLPSITMMMVKDLCATEKIEVKEEAFTLEKAYKADELLVMSTVKDITGAVELDGRPIGDGALGKITRRLIEAFAALPA